MHLRTFGVNIPKSLIRESSLSWGFGYNDRKQIEITMKIRIIFLVLLLVITFSVLAGCQKRTSLIVRDYPKPQKDYHRPLPPGELALRKITDPNQIPDYTLACSDTDRLQEAIANSLNYMAKPSSKKFYPYGDITYEQALRSLRELQESCCFEIVSPADEHGFAGKIRYVYFGRL